MTAENTTPSKAELTQEKNNEQQLEPNSSTPEKGEKTYSKADVDKLLADAQAMNKKDLEVALAEERKKSEMSKEEKQTYETEQRENAIALKELKADARALLNEQGLPAKWLNRVIGKDIKETTANINEVKLLIDETVSTQVEMRLGGKPPKRGNVDTSMSSTESMREQIRANLRG